MLPLFAVVLAILATTGSSSSALDFNAVKGHGVVTIPLMRSSNGHLANLRRSIAGLSKRQNTESLFNAQGREFEIEIDIGTPPQRFNVTLDTGR